MAGIRWRTIQNNLFLIKFEILFVRKICSSTGSKCFIIDGGCVCFSIRIHGSPLSSSLFVLPSSPTVIVFACRWPCWVDANGIQKKLESAHVLPQYVAHWYQKVEVEQKKREEGQKYECYDNILFSSPGFSPNFCLQVCEFIIQTWDCCLFCWRGGRERENVSFLQQTSCSANQEGFP